uniref:Putative oxidoreductase n=1 Tax=Mycobacterium leprae TaxID=1769 RepID=Q9X7E9_MYCLR|nr:putative oxidoreductase [Mycobacterium leprae]
MHTVPAFGTSGLLCTFPLERESGEVTLNSIVLMELTHVVLPGMVERCSGAVMNIASMVGCQLIPHMVVYAATKAVVPDIRVDYSQGVARYNGHRSRFCARLWFRPNGPRSPIPNDSVFSVVQVQPQNFT